MNRKCALCSLINYLTAQHCLRCGAVLGESENISSNRGFLKRALFKRAFVCLTVLLGVVFAFYASLVLSADSLRSPERTQVASAIRHLERSGFSREVFLLRHVTVFRANDNWLNASVQKESAYAATNFPFEIVTLYPEFFTYPIDDVERAAILLHEAKHLEGKDEKEAYEFVWRNRWRFGWTSEEYRNSLMWREIRKITREYSPELFICDFNEYGDCTER